MTATALALDFRKDRGAEKVEDLIPNRLKHGYGLTAASTDILLEKMEI
jgi:hypothetical protein